MKTKWIMGSESLVKFPFGFMPMENQVAGHNFKDGINSVGLLKHKDGYVLKPINKKQQGETEIKFYESVMSTRSEVLRVIKEFVPQFLGTVTLDIDGTNVEFMKMQDVTVGLQKPCIMDIKIGTQTWDPNASELKQEAEKKKYIASKKAFGFCIPGYQVYNVNTREFIKRGKEFGKTLSEETLPNAVREFLNSSSRSSFLVRNLYVNQLNKILGWFQKQNILHFYSSSILLLYDAEKLECLEAPSPFSQQQDINSWLRVYLIDFAHVCPALNGHLDHNYICGLEKLIDLLKTL